MAKDFEEYVESALSWQDTPTKHNKTDYSAFKRLQERDRRRSEIRHQRRMQSTIEENLNIWKDSVSERWKHADLKTIEGKHRDKIVREISEKGFKSFYFYGDTGVGKTFYAYALIKEYIRMGLFAPSQVVKVSEGQLLDMVNTGFEGRGKLTKLLDEKYKFYFFDDIGRGGIGTQDKRNALWDRVMDHIYSSDAEFVMTSNFKLPSLSDNFSEAAFDRMFLSTTGRRIEFSGDNYRLKLAQDELR